MVSQFEFQLLGDVRVVRDRQVVNIGHARQRCVLAALMVDANHAVPIDQLVDRVWADRVPYRGREALYSYLSRLRRCLTTDVRIIRQPGGYVLAVDPMTVDLHRFRRLINQASTAVDDQIKSGCLEQALGLWTGRAFTTLDTPWVNSVRDALNREKLTAELDRNDLSLRRGRHAELLADLFEAVDKCPLDERLAGQLVLALYRSGRQADALDHLRQIRHLLGEELGIDPSPALQRLHRQILTADAALEHPAASGITTSTNAGRILSIMNLPPRNPHFTGRNDKLMEIHQRLHSGQASLQVEALYGMGGVGKTQLAVEYAHRHAADYALIWWIDAGQPVFIPDQYRRLAARLGIPADGAALDVVERVHAELSQHAGWLLIFDNAQGSQDVAPYRPAGPGHLLVTSRSPAWGALGGRMPVDVLNRSETIALMVARIPAMTSGIADKLAAELGDLPLASAQAVAFMEQTEMTPANYLKRFISHRSTLLARGDVLDYQGRVDTAWDLSFDRLATFSPASLELLKIGAFLAPEPIPFALFHGHPGFFGSKPQQSAMTADSDALGDAVGAAVGFSLARRHPNAFQMHRLVQAVIRSRLAATEHDTVVARIVDMLATAHPGDPNNPEHWPILAQLAPHLLAVSPYVDRHSGVRRPILDTVAYVISRGEPRASQRIAEEFLERWRRVIGHNHRDTLSMAIHLTLALVRVDEADKARELAQETLPRSREWLGLDHPDTLRLATYLAMALAWVGDARQACELIEDTLPRFRRTTNPDAPEILMLGAYLGRALAWVGDTSQARQLSGETLARASRTLGPDHPTSLFAAVDLAFALLWAGEIAPAHALLEETLQRAREVLGPHHLITANAAAALVQALVWVGDASHAVTIAEEFLPRISHRLGPDHLTTLAISTGLSSALATLHDPAGASALGQDTFQRSFRVLGPDHPMTLISAAALTSALTALGESGHAEPLRDDLDLRANRILGPDHPAAIALTTPRSRPPQ